MSQAQSKSADKPPYRTDLEQSMATSSKKEKPGSLAATKSMRSYVNLSDDEIKKVIASKLAEAKKPKSSILNQLSSTIKTLKEQLNYKQVREVLEKEYKFRVHRSTLSKWVKQDRLKGEKCEPDKARADSTKDGSLAAGSPPESVDIRPSPDSVALPDVTNGSLAPGNGRGLQGSTQGAEDNFDSPIKRSALKSKKQIPSPYNDLCKQSTKKRSSRPQ